MNEDGMYLLVGAIIRQATLDYMDWSFDYYSDALREYHMGSARYFLECAGMLDKAPVIANAALNEAAYNKVLASE